MTKIENTQMLIQPNQMIKAHYSLNLIQKHIILMCLGILNTTKVNDPAKGVTFDIRQIYELSGSKYRFGEYTERFKKTLQTLHTSTFLINENNSEDSTYNWIKKSTVSKINSIVTVYLTEDIVKMFSQIKGNYTQCLLKNTISMSNFYAIRIYELVMQYKNTTEKDVPEMYITDLRKMLGIEKNYSTYNDLMRYVLMPAIAEISAKSDITIDFLCTGTSRMYTHIKFTYEFKTKEAEQLLLPNENKPKKRKYKKKAVSIKDASNSSFSTYTPNQLG